MEPARTRCQQHGGGLEGVYSCRFVTGRPICKGQFKGTEQPDKASIGPGASDGGCP